RALVHDVAERPQALVGEAVVVPRLFVGLQPDPAQRIGGIVGGQPDALAHDPVGIAAPVGDPHAAARDHDRLHRREEAAGRLELADATTVAHVAHRLAIREYEDRAGPEAHLDELFEPFFRPDALAAQAQSRFALGGGAHARQRAGPTGDPPC